MSAADKDQDKRGRKRADKQAGADPRQQPDWTSGLKRLYDSVVEEPLPDSFKDLLSRLDDDAK